MKKIALTSLIAMFAFAGAHAANVIDGNPLYMPKKGHFYSVSSLETSTSDVDAVALGEEFGFGITDRWAVDVSASISEEDWLKEAQWNTMGLGLTYRFVDSESWKVDAVARYGVGPVWENGHGQFFHGSFLDKDDTVYVWTVGARGGYVGRDFTIAGHIMMDYSNTESFNWDENKWTDDEVSGLHTLRAGVDAQLLLNKNWNLVSGAEYSKMLDHYNDTLGAWELTFGANYNIDATKYIGAYLTKDVLHVPTATEDGNWEIQDGFGMGVKFGIDF
jgi:hypothetical protein